MKLKRLALLGIVGVLLVAVLGVGGVLMYMDSIAKAAIERGGTYALGVDVRLGSADIQPLAGRFDMHSFSVANPQGFGTEKFMKLDDGGVAVTLGSLRSDIVELGELKLTSLNMQLMQDGRKSNYGVILDNLKRFESSGTAKEPSSGSGKKFVIREVDLSGITVHVGMAQLGGSVPIKIDRIQLKNVGTAGDPVSMAELVAVLLKAVLRSAVEHGGGLIPADMLGDLQGALAQLSTENVQKIVEGMAGETAAEAVRQLQGQLGDQAKELDKKLQSETNKLKSLLPLNKNDNG
jgi:hypothetical protein